jgi:hypothetical protein
MIQSQYKSETLFDSESNYLISPLSQLNGDKNMISQRCGKFESLFIVRGAFVSFVIFQYQSFPINSLTRWLFKFHVSCCFTSFAFFFNSKTLFFMQMVKLGLFFTRIRLTWLFRVQQILVSKSILTSNFRQIYASFQAECFPFNFDCNVFWISSLDEIVSFRLPALRS